MINKDSIVRFSMRRPDLGSFELRQRLTEPQAGTPDEWAGPIPFRGYRDHVVTTLDDGFPTRTTTIRLIDEGQGVTPKPLDFIFDVVEERTWEIIPTGDVNTLGGMIFCPSRQLPEGGA